LQDVPLTLKERRLVLIFGGNAEPPVLVYADQCRIDAIAAAIAFCREPTTRFGSDRSEMPPKHEVHDTLVRAIAELQCGFFRKNVDASHGLRRKVADLPEAGDPPAIQ